MDNDDLAEDIARLARRTAAPPSVPHTGPWTVHDGGDGIAYYYDSDGRLCAMAGIDAARALSQGQSPGPRAQRRAPGSPQPPRARRPAARRKKSKARRSPR